MKEKADLISLTDRGTMLLLEHCRVEQRKNTVVFVKAENGYSKYFNIPYINTSIIFLGAGTSITSAAVGKLTKQGVLVAFTDGEGFPLNGALSVIEPQNEYRPVKYNHAFAKIFLNNEKRLEKAKTFLKKRTELTHNFYLKLYDENLIGFLPIEYTEIKEKFLESIQNIDDIQSLLTAEGRYTQDIYNIFASNYGILGFKRDKDEKTGINGHLTHLNYIAYGISATILYAFGISHSFSVLHGKTRRGALVFDIADLFKDGLSIPLAFYAGTNGMSDSEIKHLYIKKVFDFNVLKIVANFIKEIVEENEKDD